MCLSLYIYITKSLYQTLSLTFNPNQTETVSEPPSPKSSELPSLPYNNMKQPADQSVETKEDHYQNHLALDLSLSNKIKDSTNLISSYDQFPELNLTTIKAPEDQGYPHNNQGNSNVNGSEHRVFACNYCQRKFYSSQALGGHQNAHKRERTLEKRRTIYQRSSFAASHAAYIRNPNSIASLPLHGSSMKTPLGVQVHSMIHKPPFFSSCNYNHEGHKWKSQVATIDHQLQLPDAVGRQNHFHGSIQIGKFSPATVNEGMAAGFCNWDKAVTLSSFKTKQDDEMLKLDLSLKL